jgi:hypothetical protein
MRKQPILHASAYRLAWRIPAGALRLSSILSQSLIVQQEHIRYIKIVNKFLDDYAKCRGILIMQGAREVLKIIHDDQGGAGQTIRMGS